MKMSYSSKRHSQFFLSGKCSAAAKCTAGTKCCCSQLERSSQPLAPFPSIFLSPERGRMGREKLFGKRAMEKEKLFVMASTATLEM